MDRTNTDVAWCAGFFDGEGHVSYRRSYPDKRTNRVSSTIMCSIPQNSDNIEVLEFFQSVIGFGEIKGPYRDKKRKEGNTYHIVSYGVHQVEELLKILAPYLKSKKLADFHVALLAYWSHDRKPTAEDFARRIKRNKKKGCTECSKEWNGMVCAHCGYIE